MKLTKSKLQQIIKEEIEKLIEITDPSGLSWGSTFSPPPSPTDVKSAESLWQKGSIILQAEYNQAIRQAATEWAKMNNMNTQKLIKDLTTKVKEIRAPQEAWKTLSDAEKLNLAKSNKLPPHLRPEEAVWEALWCMVNPNLPDCKAGKYNKQFRNTTPEGYPKDVISDPNVKRMGMGGKQRSPMFESRKNNK